MMLSVPALTWGTLPETGVWSILAPRPSSRTRAASFRLAPGLIVLRSAQTLPFGQTGKETVGSFRDRLDHVVVGKRRQDDIRRLRGSSRGVSTYRRPWSMSHCAPVRLRASPYTV